MRLLPSTDLYFRNACDRFVRRALRSGPIVQRGRNSYVCGDTLLLLRQDDERLMLDALEWSGKLAYVIDDDIAGAASSPALPDHYRRRLALFDQMFHQPLLRRADILLVPSDALGARFAGEPAIGARIERIAPYWNLPLADQSHFRTIRKGGQLRIVHLGSASHAGALRLVAPPIADLLDRHRQLSFTYVGREPLHPRLAGHAQVWCVAPMGWRRYRRWLSGRRFHLALYPLDDSPFDHARSSNKLIEHAIVGAVGIYPESWAPAHVLGDAAFAAPSAPPEWANILNEAVSRPERLIAMAEQSAAVIADCNDPAGQRRLWSSIFDIEMHSDLPT